VSSIEVRHFRRSDGGQLTRLVNAHAAAVIPGATVSINTVLAQLERLPDEFIVGPWVSERVTLVAEQQNRVAAAAHVLRHYDDERAGDDYRNHGEIYWLLFWPHAPVGNPYWVDGLAAAEQVMDACLRQFDDWGASTQGAAGELPAPGVYGVPEQWPHVRRLYEQAGFTQLGQTESVHCAEVAHLVRHAPAAVAGASVRRAVGINGTRLTATVGDDVIGYIEVELMDRGERVSRGAGWADIGNLHVTESHSYPEVAGWLLAEAARWLHLASVERLLAYAVVERPDASIEGEEREREFLTAAGFVEVTRTRRGWTRGPKG
jgi:hypothetical protein